MQRTDFKNRGSELNDGRLAITESDEQCCELCQNSSGTPTTDSDATIPVHRASSCILVNVLTEN